MPWCDMHIHCNYLHYSLRPPLVRWVLRRSLRLFLLATTAGRMWRIMTMSCFRVTMIWMTLQAQSQSQTTRRYTHRYVGALNLQIFLAISESRNYGWEIFYIYPLRKCRRIPQLRPPAFLAQVPA